jgi:hypothetical protein
MVAFQVPSHQLGQAEKLIVANKDIHLGCFPTVRWRVKPQAERAFIVCSSYFLVFDNPSEHPVYPVSASRPFLRILSTVELWQQVRVLMGLGTLGLSFFDYLLLF